MSDNKHYKVITAQTLDELESKLNYEYDAGLTSESIMRKNDQYWKPILMTYIKNDRIFVVILEKGINTLSGALYRNRGGTYEYI